MLRDSHSSHRKIITLINEIDLQEDMINLPKEIKYKLAKKVKFQLQKPSKKLLKKEKFSDDHLKKYHIFSISCNCLDFDTAGFIQESFSYIQKLLN